MMIDDIFVSIGSANLNRRGFFHDGELNVFAIPEALRSAPDNPARALRTALWAEQLGLPPVMGSRARRRHQRVRSLPAIAVHHACRAVRRDRHSTAGRRHRLRPRSWVADADAQGAGRDLVGIALLEQMLDELWNMVIDPTSFVDPNPQSGPV